MVTIDCFIVKQLIMTGGNGKLEIVQKLHEKFDELRIEGQWYPPAKKIENAMKMQELRKTVITTSVLVININIMSSLCIIKYKNQNNKN